MLYKRTPHPDPLPIGWGEGRGEGSAQLHRVCRKAATRSIALIFWPAFFLVTHCLADGPGLGNLTYAPGELYSTIATFTSANSAPRGHGFTPMHKGYLVVIFSNDGGGGNGSGGFTFYNVSNPRSPQATFTTYNNPA